MALVELRGHNRPSIYAIVDDDDFEQVSQFCWRRKDCPYTTYARRHVYVDGKRISQYMHSFLTGWAQVDHINHDGLDNRRSNLREATHAQNCGNRRRVGGSSVYKGVSWYKVRQKWQAYIRINGRLIHLGHYKSEMAAALAYDAAARKYFGEYALLNLPIMIENHLAKGCAVALLIRTTGLDQYAPGGRGRLKMLIIGGGGSGKTRMASFWPRPIYADCEGGLASVADRKVPFVEVHNSIDMLSLLDYLLKLEEDKKRPVADRPFQTVVIDTLDAFQRKVKDEWLRSNPAAQSFRGYDAWGYLDAKVGMLLTRLLNLDMNVIVNCHYKDKIIKEGTGENATERQELMLQLSGEVKDSVFNDFDLVGWLGTYWEAVEGQRVERRGLTFKRTPDKPFLKDRLHVTPEWMQIIFADEDYTNLFMAVVGRLDNLAETEEIGQIPTDGEPDILLGTGAMPTQRVPELEVVGLARHDRPTLAKMARDLGCPVRGNSIKSELIEMIEAKQRGVEPTPESSVAAAPALVPSGPATDDVLTSVSTAQSASPAALVPPVVPLVVERVPEGVVDTATGELVEAKAIATAEEVLGAQVLSVRPTVETPATESAVTQSAAVDVATCEFDGCTNVLAGENQSLVKLGQVKFSKDLCGTHFEVMKAQLVQKLRRSY